MKFYNRDSERRQLVEIRQRAFENHSQMTMITGRRRIGKTKLILKSCETTPTLYLFVSRNSEMTLCRQFSEEVRKILNIPVPDGIQSFVDLFAQIMTIGRIEKFNLVIDEFQEFYNINPSIFSGIQDIWDRQKDITHVNFIASGSVHTLLHNIFMDYSAPLYGRCDMLMKVPPFTTSVLKEILADHHPTYTNDDLLALYMITGGIPKYVELLMDRGAFTVEDILKRVTEENSIFLEEGTILLAQEFGKKYGNYHSILSAIASGRNTVPEIAREIGDISLGGMLNRLENDYELISKKRPVLSKERSQNVRYEIADNFLCFWFRYITRNQDLIQVGLYDRLYETVLADYPTFSGMILERWFRQKMRESGLYRTIGSWWNTSKEEHLEPSEIDIVALSAEKKKQALVAEVKRQGKNFREKAFIDKVNRLHDKVLPDYKIESQLLTLEEM